MNRLNTSLFTATFFVKLLVVLTLLLSGSNALAHSGHGGSSLMQHALEHGYMLVPATVLLIVVLRIWLKKKAD